MREAKFTLPIFNRALVVRDSEGLHNDARMPPVLGKVSKKDDMGICGHDRKDIAFLGIERPGPCCILVVNKPWHIPHDIC